MLSVTLRETFVSSMHSIGPYHPKTIQIGPYQLRTIQIEAYHPKIITHNNKDPQDTPTVMTLRILSKKFLKTNSKIDRTMIVSTILTI